MSPNDHAFAAHIQALRATHSYSSSLPLLCSSPRDSLNYNSFEKFTDLDIDTDHSPSHEAAKKRPKTQRAVQPTDSSTSTARLAEPIPSTQAIIPLASHNLTLIEKVTTISETTSPHTTSNSSSRSSKQPTPHSFSTPPLKTDPIDIFEEIFLKLIEKNTQINGIRSKLVIESANSMQIKARNKKRPLCSLHQKPTVNKELRKYISKIKNYIKDLKKSSDSTIKPIETKKLLKDTLNAFYNAKKIEEQQIQKISIDRIHFINYRIHLIAIESLTMQLLRQLENINPEPSHCPSTRPLIASAIPFHPTPQVVELQTSFNDYIEGIKKLYEQQKPIVKLKTINEDLKKEVEKNKDSFPSWYKITRMKTAFRDAQLNLLLEKTNKCLELHFQNEHFLEDAYNNQFLQEIIEICFKIKEIKYQIIERKYKTHHKFTEYSLLFKRFKMRKDLLLQKISECLND